MEPLNQDDIKKMRKVCRLAGETLIYVGKHISVGMTTNDLDKLVEDFTRTNGATSGPLNYKGYPKSICTSVNGVICHGLPNDIPLKDGDIVNVDVTPFMDGFFGDTSCTYLIGNVSGDAQRLVECAHEARNVGIRAIAPGATTGDIGFDINKFVTRKGYSVVKELGGHGIGRVFHYPLFIPSFGKRGRGEILQPWTCITIEPMINLGSPDIINVEIPGCEVMQHETADGKLSAQFEHTVLITDTGYEVLTIV